MQNEFGRKKQLPELDRMRLDRFHDAPTKWKTGIAQPIALGA